MGSSETRGRPDRHRSHDREGTGRGMEPFVLLELAHGPAHGYQLAATMAQLGFHRAATDPSVVYKLLRTLEGRDYVNSGWRVDEQHAPQRVYELTESGQCYLAERAGELRRHAERIELFLARYDARFPFPATPAVTGVNPEATG